MGEVDVVRELSAKVTGHTRRDDERESLLRRARGRTDLILLGRGDPDLPTPRNIVQAAQRALDDGATRYTHWQGDRQLRTAIAQMYAQRVGGAFTPEQVVVTNGAQEAIFVTLHTLLDPGDEVIIARPHYTSYLHAVRFAGGTTVTVDVRQEDDWVLQPADVRAKIGPRTKALILVSPDNPTGSVIPSEVMAEFAALVRETGIFVVMDEIYAQWVFDGRSHASILVHPEVNDRTIVVNGFSKTYSMTGWRVGYLIAPEHIVHAMELVKHTVSICAPAPSQAGALEAITGPQTALDEMYRIYEERRAVLLKGLGALGITCTGSVGGLYLFANIAALGLGSLELCSRLLDAGVQLFPSTPFGGGTEYVRIAYLAPVEELEVAVERLHAVPSAL